jgi:hypothetical protein
MGQMRAFGLFYGEGQEFPVQRQTSELYFGKHDECGQEWVGDIGGRVRDKCVEPKWHAHQETEGKMKPKHRLHADIETDGNTKASAPRLQLSAPESRNQMTDELLVLAMSQRRLVHY